MDFKQDKAIYMQLVDRLCDEILSGKYQADDRIPSVREFAVLLAVNTNTVVKAYDQLSLSGIIYTRRGLGNFVSPQAREHILSTRRQRFMNESLPEVFRQMQLLGISISQVDALWSQHLAAPPADDE